MITALNIGTHVYELFHKLSKSLKGESKALAERLAEIDGHVEIYRKSLHDGGNTLDGTFYPFQLKNAREAIEEQIIAWSEYKTRLLKGGQSLLSKEEREFYLNPGDCVQSYSHYLNLMLHCRNRRVRGIYQLSDIFMNTGEIKELLKQEGITPPPLKGYGEEAEAELVNIFRNLDEPQIHFYGNLEPVSETLLRKFRPLGRCNLGRELAYCLDKFVMMDPPNSFGKNMGVDNVPYTIDGNGTSYKVRWVVQGSPPIFTGISIKDMKQLIK